GAGLTERYEVSAQGVYQSFVFDERPAGQGDLVVRGSLDTVLFADPAADGGLDLTWNGRDGIHYGGVVGIDADGDRVRGGLRLVNGSLELSLPATFVDTADYPIVLDPLIGTTVAVDDSGNSDSNPSLANTPSGLTLAMWERRFSASHIELYGHRLTPAAGSLFGDLIPIYVGDGVIARNPSAGYVKAAQSWLAAFEVQLDPLDEPSVYVTSFRDEQDVADATPISNSANAQRTPDVGGDGTGTDNEAFVVWSEEGVGVRGMTVTTQDGQQPAPLGAAFTIDANAIGNQAIHPKISPIAIDRPEFLVVWELDLANTQRSTVLGRFYTRNGGPLSDEFTLFQNFDQFYGHYAPDVSGRGERFVVAWERSESFTSSPAHDVVVRAIDWDGANIDFTGQHFVANDDGVDESDVSVVLTNSAALVGFRKQSGFVKSVFLRNIDPFTAQPIGEAVELPGSGAADTVSMSRGSDSYHGRVLVAWGDGLTRDIEAQVYEAVGEVQGAGGGCGDGGWTRIPGALAGNQDFTVYLRDSVPSVPAICVLGFSDLGFACGGCVFRPSPDVVLISATDVEGHGTVAFPLNPGTAGAEFYAQWMVFPPNSGSCLGVVDFAAPLQVRVADQP
ncbi:MAG: hypothetical protein AAFZ65_17810, partial [Planctomycetota bacterium]